jgi:lysozyme
MLDAAGLTLLKQFEGCRLDAYQDTAGVWTIGYGHPDGVTEGMTITRRRPINSSPMTPLMPSAR